MYVCVWVCECIAHGGQTGHWISQGLELQDIQASQWYWELNSGPLSEQYTLSVSESCLLWLDFEVFETVLLCFNVPMIFSYIISWKVYSSKFNLYVGYFSSVVWDKDSFVRTQLFLHHLLNWLSWTDPLIHKVFLITSEGSVKPSLDKLFVWTHTTVLTQDANTIHLEYRLFQL